MLQKRLLTSAETELMLEQLETIADRLFTAGNNTLGNAVQEVVYCLEATVEEATGD